MGQRRQTPGRPATFVVTRGFLDHFGLGSEKDLPGLAELRAAGLIDNDGSAGPLFGGEEPDGAEQEAARALGLTDLIHGSQARDFLL